MWFAVLLVCVALAARFIPGPRNIDDSFITFRYARNILAGNGFLYNPGERVLGTTTPLYTSAMVLVGALSGGTQAPFPWLALGLNAVADAITCLLLLWLGRRLRAPVVGVSTALVWAIAPFSVTFAIGGLETSVYVLLLTAAVSANLAGKRKTAAGLAALAFLTRPDALILLALLGVERFRELIFPVQGDQRSLSMRLRALLPELAWFVIPIMLWLVFSTLYFGSPLPHSIAAKSVAYRQSAEAGLVRLIQHYATPFQENNLFGNLWNGLGFVVNLFLFTLGARRLLRSERQVWPWLAYPWVYFIVFAAANPLIFRWYMTPPLPPYMFVILAGLERLLGGGQQQLAGARIQARKKLAVALRGMLLVGLPVALSLTGWSWKLDHGATRPAPEMAWIKLELLYRQAAGLISPQMAAAATPPVLAAGDVGVLGFYTPSIILDTVGLNSPLTLEYYPLDEALFVINYAVPADLILDQLPDYIVLLEVYIRNGLLQDPRFAQHYTLLHKLPTDIYGSDGMLIFTRRTP